MRQRPFMSTLHGNSRASERLFFGPFVGFLKSRPSSQAKFFQTLVRTQVWLLRLHLVASVGCWVLGSEATRGVGAVRGSGDGDKDEDDVYDGGGGNGEDGDEDDNDNGDWVGSGDGDDGGSGSGGCDEDDAKGVLMVLGKVRFLLGGGGGGGGGLGLFGCIVFSKVLTLPPGPAKEKHDPSQKIT